MPASMPQMPRNSGTVVGPPPTSTEIARTPIPSQLIPAGTFFISLLQLQVPCFNAEWMI